MLAALSAGMNRMSSVLDKFQELGLTDKLETIIDKCLSIINTPFMQGLNLMLSMIQAETTGASAHALTVMIDLLAKEETQKTIKNLADILIWVINDVTKAVEIFSWFNVQWQNFLALFGDTGQVSAPSQPTGDAGYV